MIAFFSKYKVVAKFLLQHIQFRFVPLRIPAHSKMLVFANIIWFLLPLETKAIAFTNEPPNLSSTNVDVESIQNQMIKEFANKHGIKYLNTYYDSNEKPSLKALQRLVVKAKRESIFVVSKEVSDSINKQEKQKITGSSFLHLYIPANLDNLGRLIKSEKPENMSVNNRKNPSDQLWLVRKPENRSKNQVQRSLEDIEIDDGIKIFFYWLQEDYKIDIAIMYKTNMNSAATLKPFYTWSQNEGFSSSYELNREKEDSLNGQHIRIVSVYNPPSVSYIQDNCSSKSCFKGLFPDVWHAIVDQFNLTFTVTQVYQWGSVEKGKWNGMVGMLHEGKADIAVGDLTPTPERSNVVDFLPTIVEITEDMYMKNPGDVFSLVSYFGPFTKLSWICILLWIIGAPLLLVIIVWSAARVNRSNVSIFNCYIAVTAFLLNVSRAAVPNQHSIRLALACVLIGGMAFYYHWDAELIAYMSVRKINLPFENLKELSETQGFKLLLPKGSVHIDTFRDSDDPIYSKIWKEKVNPFYDDLPLADDLLKRLKNEPYSVVYSDSTAKMRDPYLNCEIVDVGPPVRRSQLAFAVQKNSPFYEKFRDQITKFKETGLVGRYVQRYSMERQACKSYDGSAISMHQCFVMFQILFLGAIVSLLWLLGELSASYFRKKNNSDRIHGAMEQHVKESQRNAKAKNEVKKTASISTNQKSKTFIHRRLREDGLRKELAKQKLLTRQLRRQLIRGWHDQIDMQSQNE